MFFLLDASPRLPFSFCLTIVKAKKAIQTFFVCDPRTVMNSLPAAVVNSLPVAVPLPPAATSHKLQPLHGSDSDATDQRGWTQEGEDTLCEWLQMCQYSGYLHSRTAKYFDKQYYYLIIPSTILSCIVASATSTRLAGGQSEPHLVVQIVLAIFSVISTVCAALSALLRPKDKHHAHREVALAYKNLCLIIKTQLSLPYPKRDEMPIFFEAVSADIHRLQNVDMDIPNWVVAEMQTLLRSEGLSEAQLVLGALPTHSLGTAGEHHKEDVADDEKAGKHNSEELHGVSIESGDGHPHDNHPQPSPRQTTKPKNNLSLSTPLPAVAYVSDRGARGAVSGGYSDAGRVQQYAFKNRVMQQIRAVHLSSARTSRVTIDDLPEGFRESHRDDGRQIGGRLSFVDEKVQDEKGH